MLRTLVGRDWQAERMGNVSATTHPANVLALSTSDTAPDEGDTALPGLIESGGLAPAAATYAHTSGQSTYTLTRQFVADSADVVRKVGVMTSTSNILVLEGLLSSAAPLTEGDKLTITVTVDLAPDPE